MDTYQDDRVISGSPTLSVPLAKMQEACIAECCRFFPKTRRSALKIYFVSGGFEFGAPLSPRPPEFHGALEGVAGRNTPQVFRPVCSRNPLAGC